jgi:hypothetical protein
LPGPAYQHSGAGAVPTGWLKGSPFVDYFVPSLILLVVVGGSFLTAAYAVLAGLRIGRRAALAAGFVVLGWLTAQIAIIGYVSWMQPTIGAAGILVIGLAWLLPNPRESLETLEPVDSTRREGTP